MPAADDADALNLSGTWHGLYSYPRRRDPVPFTAMLIETASWLRGATEETVAVGAASVTMRTTMDGRRTGHAVTLLKLYDGSHRGYDTVHYAGEVSSDGTEIQGRWTVPNGRSGSFLMIRSNGPAAVATRTATERV